MDQEKKETAKNLTIGGVIGAVIGYLVSLIG